MSKKSEKIFWGIFFILASVLLIASQFVSFIELNLWSLVWTVFLVAIMIRSIPSLFFGGMFFPIALLYNTHHFFLGLPSIKLWILLFAAGLLTAGFESLFWKRKSKFKTNKYNHNYQQISHEGLNYGQTVAVDDNEHIYIKTSFSGETRYVHSKNFKSAQIYSKFGGTEVYFDDTIVNEKGAEIYVEAMFGGMELYIPSTWNIDVDISCSFGATEYSGFGNPDPNAPKVRIYGNARFGGVEINYIN